MVDGEQVVALAAGDRDVPGGALDEARGGAAVAACELDPEAGVLEVGEVAADRLPADSLTLSVAHAVEVVETWRVGPLSPPDETTSCW